MVRLPGRVQALHRRVPRLRAPCYSAARRLVALQLAAQIVIDIYIFVVRARAVPPERAALRAACWQKAPAAGVDVCVPVVFHERFFHAMADVVPAPRKRSTKRQNAFTQ